MLTTIAVVGLFPLASITVDASTYDYPYITCLTDTSGISTVYLSQDPIYVYTSNRTSSYDGPYFYDIAAYTESPVIELVYGTSINQWQTNAIHAPSEEVETGYRLGQDTRYTGKFVYLIGYLYSTDTYQQYHIITNTSYTSLQQGYFLSYSNDVDSLPQGLTESAVRDIINDQINTQTSAGQTAQTIINNTTTQYNLYLSGDINSSEMLENVTSNIDTLSGLSPSTLLDAMQINNGLTYNQSIQDQILNNASSQVSQMFDQYIRLGASYTYYQYQIGEKTQSQANVDFNKFLREISNKLSSGTITSTADIEAVNAMINMIHSYQQMIYNEKDLNVDVSEKVQESDAEEIQYLEELTNDATSTITDIAPSQNFTSSQTGDAQDVLELIWQNEFVKRLLPMCAGFMVVCCVLGIRYRV